MLIFATWTLLSAVLAAPCPTSEIKRQGRIKHDSVVEASGLVSGKEWLWIHNDSGDGPKLYAVNKRGEKRAAIQISEAFARDWEEMAPFSEQGKQYFMIGDIGDNKERKESVHFYVIERPSSSTNQPLLYEFTADYGDLGAKDAEAFFVDPISQQIILITKGRDGIHHFLQATFPLPSTQQTTGTSILEDPHFRAEHIQFTEFFQQTFADLPMDKREQSRFITAASIHPDGSWIVIRNYLSAKMYHRGAADDWATVFQQEPCSLPLPLQQQGETISFSPDGSSLWTISEGTKQMMYQIHLNFE